MSESGKAVFLSYASQDAGAAQRICELLREAGVEVWFDQSELVGGDLWDQKIRKQIRDCALLIPVISRNTQARREAYFRLEWRLADERTHLMAQGTPFLLPVTIDETKDRDALVPDSFLAVQWTRAPGGELPAAFCARVRALLHGGDTAERPRPVGPADAAGRPARSASTPRWFRPVLASTVLAALALAVTLWRRSHEQEPGKPPAIAASPAVAEKLSPARELARRAQVILKRGSLTRAQLDAAEELCERALQADTTDAEVWIAAAQAEIAYIYPYGYDTTEERRRRAQERVARAASLNPDMFEVRVAQAEVFAHAVATPALMAEAEKTFRQLLVERPGDRSLTFQLAEVLRGEGRYEEAAKLFATIGEFEMAGWSYYLGGELRSALAEVARAPRSVTTVELQAILEVGANEDLAAAQAVIDRLPASDLLSEMPGVVAMRVAMYRRDPARILEIAKGLNRDYLDSNAFRGPLAYFTGLAQEMAGRPALAAVEWRAALPVVAARLKATPDDRELLMWSAWLHAALGGTAEAETILARGQALAGLSGDTIDVLNYRVLLRLRKKEALLAGAKELLRFPGQNGQGSHAEMRFSPEYDFLRSDPRFEKLLRDHLPPGAVPLDGAVAQLKS